MVGRGAELNRVTRGRVPVVDASRWDERTLRTTKDDTREVTQEKFRGPFREPWCSEGPSLTGHWRWAKSYIRTY